MSAAQRAGGQARPWQPGAVTSWPARGAFVAACGLLAALQVGPLVGLLGFRWTQQFEWTLNGAARDLAVAALLLMAVLAGCTGSGHARLPASARWALAMVAAYTVAGLADPSGPLLTAMNLRRLVLVPLLFVAVLAIPWSALQVDRLFRMLVVSCAAVAVLGIVERAAPEALWTDWLDIDAYTAASNLDRFGQIPFADSGRYFSTDLESVLGGPLRRMISTYLEPTTLAAAMAVLLTLALARRARGHPSLVLIVLSVVAGCATLSKGFIAYLLMLAAWRVVGVPAPRHISVMVLAGCGLALLADPSRLEGPLEHVAGLASSLRGLAGGAWLGHGVGAAGNLSDLGNDSGEESGLGNVMAQVGVLTLLSVAWLRALVHDVLAAAAARRDPGGPWVAAWLVFWTLTYLFSASSLGVGGNALGFIAIALYLHPASRPHPACAR
jgi:hypothetical protein